MDLLDEEPDEPEFDPERFREAILYIGSLPSNKRELSETKLHKILFYADRKAYFELGEPITGARYVRHDHGPFATELRDTLTELESEKSILIRQYEVGGVEITPDTQRCFDVFEGADTGHFSDRELQILTEVAREIFPLDSETVSEQSHDVVWRSVEPYEEIPYYLSYLQVTEKDDSEEIMDWAREKTQEIRDG